MASSRLEKIGTIYSRVTGLLKSGAMKEADTPVWYAVYKAFPPEYEPKYDRPAPKITIPNIFYSEDVIRAKFHKQQKLVGTVNMNNTFETRAQKFISYYKQLQEEGNTSESDLFDSALKLLKENDIGLREQNESETGSTTDEQTINSTLASSFRKAQEEISRSRPGRPTSNNKTEINLKDMLKD